MFREMFNKKIKQTLNEEIQQINDKGIGSIISYSLFMVSQAHMWHLLCPDAQQHTVLGEFYNKLNDEVDELAERFLAQGGVLNDVDMPLIAKYSEFEVLRNLEDLRNIVTSAIDTDPIMASIVDGLVDIQELIDNIIYKFKLR